MNFKNILVSNGQDSKTKQYFNVFLAGVIVLLLVFISTRNINLAFNFSFIADYKDRIFSGFMTTIWLSISSLILSVLIGVFTAFLQNSNILIAKHIANLYVTFIRGTPLIMQIYLFYYIIGTSLGVDDRFTAGVIILSIFEGAYIAEIIRGSFSSIDKSQLESAKAVGFTKKQTLTTVILPQLVVRTLPALAGQFASIIKDSSLLSMISVIEITQTMREISSTNFRLFEAYIFLGVLYLLLTLPITIISKKLERKFSYEN